jgi:FkbM family methyltransferase
MNISKLLANICKPASSRLVDIHLDELPIFTFAVHKDLTSCRYLSSEIAHNKTWEAFETSLFVALCETNDFIVDIGAHIGWYSTVASYKIGAGGHILCFEPNPYNYKLLEWNIRQSPNADKCRMLPYAVGSTNHQGYLYCSVSNSGDNRIVDDAVLNKKIEIKIITLDDIFLCVGGEKLPTIVKCDAQGAEYDILLGAEMLFQHMWRPVWFVEYWPYALRRAGHNPKDFYRKLFSMQYTIINIEWENCLALLEEQDILRILEADLFANGEGFLNLIAIQRNSLKWDRIEQQLHI